MYIFHAITKYETGCPIEKLIEKIKEERDDRLVRSDR